MCFCWERSGWIESLDWDSIIQVQKKVTFQMGADYIGSPFYPDNQQVPWGKWRKCKGVENVSGMGLVWLVWLLGYSVQVLIRFPTQTFTARLDFVARFPKFTNSTNSDQTRLFLHHVDRLYVT